MKATRSDVAKLAGVSTATVSNVINNGHMVKDETAERVWAAIEKLNYRPNMVARSLTTQRTMQIGVLLEDIHNPFYGEIVKYIEAAANRHGYFVNICVTSDNFDNYFDSFISRSLDGVFVAALPSQFNMEKLNVLLESGIKLVTSGNLDVDTSRISTIEHNYEVAMAEAIDYLVGLGHKDIVYLNGLDANSYNDTRYTTYATHMEELGLPVNFLGGVYPYRTDVTSGYEQTMRLLEQGSHFTAIICCNDMMAIGAMRALSEQGMKVPDDVSVMGFDGVLIGKYQQPSLTTMAVDAKAFGENIFGLLNNSINKDQIDHLSSHLTLLERESTGKCMR